MSSSPAATRAKVFCIGFNKTGTISLHNALTSLGYRSLHWGGPPVREKIEQALAEGRPLVDDLGDYDAYSDILVLSTNFATLDEQYPGSKFILTTRDVESWLKSRREHVARNVARRAAGEYEGHFLHVDEPAWRREWVTHHAKVRDYFAHRPADLLVMDIIGGDGYEVLCPFLGHETRSDPFPWQHQGATRTDSPAV